VCIRYKKLEALAQKILAKNPDATEVLDKLRQLKGDQDQIEDLWKKKNKELSDAKDLQVGGLWSVETTVAVHSCIHCIKITAFTHPLLSFLYVGSFTFLLFYAFSHL